MGSGSWRWESRFSEVRVCGCGIFACKIKALLKLKNFSNMCFFLLSLYYYCIIFVWDAALWIFLLFHFSGSMRAVQWGRGFYDMQLHT